MGTITKRMGTIIKKSGWNFNIFHLHLLLLVPLPAAFLPFPPTSWNFLPLNPLAAPPPLPWLGTPLVLTDALGCITKIQQLARWSNNSKREKINKIEESRGAWDGKESHVSLGVWKLGCEDEENQLALDLVGGWVAASNLLFGASWDAVWPKALYAGWDLVLGSWDAV